MSHDADPDPQTTPPETTHSERPRGAGSLSSARKAILGALLVVIVGAGIALFTTGDNDDSPPLAAGELSEFHQLEITTLTGEQTNFSSLAGKPVVLNFFASWCGPCVAEMPTLEALHQDLGAELTIVGLAIEGVRPASEIVEQTGVTYLTGLDEDGILLERFDGFGMPTTVFIDANGTVVDTHIGELTDGAFRDRLREHFGIGDV